MKRTDIIHAALQAAIAFHSRKLWKRFTNYDCFGVRVAGEDDLIIGGVLGDAGEEYGLSLFRGLRRSPPLQDYWILKVWETMSWRMWTF